MDYKETLMWKDISETPVVLGSIMDQNKKVMTELLTAIRKSKATNFVAAARGASDHALTYFKYLFYLFHFPG